MTRLIIGAIVLAWAVAGCGGSGADGSAETLARVQQAASTCKNYDGYTAALAEATIDCLGAIGPRDYTTDALGFLTPAFDTCPAEIAQPKGTVSALVRIRRLLSLQQDKRREFVPLSVACIRDAYLQAAKTLVGNGVTVCPNWHKQFAGGVPSKRNAVLLASRMPKPVLRSNPNEKDPVWVIDPPKRGSGFRFPKEYFFYTVSFDTQKVPPDQMCGGPVACAKACATLFEGFFVGRFGKYVVGDPYWWLDPTVYDTWTGADDPYNRVNGYYHPMSLAGDDVPGEIYGDFARSPFEENPVPPPNADLMGEAELCTRWDGTDHRMGRLVQDRLFADQPDTWLSVCELYPPALPAPL